MDGCFSRTMNNKIKHLHERCLHIAYSDKISSFKKLSETDRSVPIHIRNLQNLATGIFKVSKDLVRTVFSELFSKRSVQYNLSHASELSVPDVKSIFYGRESLSYLGPKIWDFPFKKAIKK